MMTTKEKGRRSREERRHGGCTEGKGVTLAQQERRSGRKGPQVCKTSSVRFPARALPGKRRDWLQRQGCGKIGEPLFCGLRRTRNSARPFVTVWPVAAEPSNNLIVFLGRESLSLSDSREETTIGGAMPTNGRLAKLPSRAEGVREGQQVVCELRFHVALIVGCIPLCNRKHPIGFWRGKFPIIAA